ncbi:hypothetical protein L7F22_026911 [Adiantum nelumboides]|nr:hypothetical protein [Adiantum nelumboides]
MGVQVERAPIEAWYMDDSLNDQRLPHHLEPKQYISPEQLADLGVLHWVLDADNYEHDVELQKIRQDRGYTYHDIVDVAPDKLPNYEAKLKTFYEEHIHTDEEIRFVLEGSGYFDVRDLEDRWVRIWVKKGDMIILPAGIYHRFTLDESNYAKVLRLFVGEPVWTPYNRPQDEHPVRKEYLTSFSKNHQLELMAH